MVQACAAIQETFGEFQVIEYRHETNWGSTLPVYGICIRTGFEKKLSIALVCALCGSVV